MKPFVVPDLSIADVRPSIAAAPPSRLEQLGGRSSRIQEDLDASLKGLLTGGWGWGGERFELSDTPVWSGYSRSFEFRLQSWEPFLRLAAGFETTGAEIYYSALKKFAFAWLRQVYVAPKVGPDGSLLGELDEQSFPMAWYDMAVGLRTYRLAWFCERIAADASVTDAAFRSALRALYVHLGVLARDKSFSSHSNHGFYQAIGQFAAARRFADLPMMAAYAEQGLQRWQNILSTQFSNNGVHLEHSPGYHQMVLGTLLGARTSGLLAHLAVPPDLSKMQEVLSWMIAPDFTLAPIGDTDPQFAGENLGAVEELEVAPLAWLVSGGRTGTDPPMGAAEYRTEGYAFGRLLSAGEDDPRRAAWLAQHCGFHSRTHKHADHGSFIWHDQGRAILVDPGRYDYGPRSKPGSTLAKAGNWYSDPRRIYVESTRAHNCVEIDGLDYPRVGVLPFGSGLQHCSVQSGGVVTECEFRHFETIRHRRVVFMKPGAYLLVIDWLADTKAAPHEFRQLFTFAPNWLLDQKADRIDVTDSLAPSRDLVVKPMLPDMGIEQISMGREDPELAGWTSPGPRRLVPAPRIGLRTPPSSGAVFCTLFAFGSDISVGETTQIAPAFTSGTLSWRQDGRGQRVEFVRGAKRQIKIAAMEI